MILLIAGLLALQSGMASTEVAPEVKWKKWVDEENQRLKTSPTSYLNLNDAAYLKKGQSVFLQDGPVSVRTVWRRTAPPKSLLEIRYDGEHAWLEHGKDKPLDLLLEKKWKTPYGLWIAADKLADGDLRLKLHNPDHPDLKKFNGLAFYPFNPKAVIQAKIEKQTPFKRVKFPTVRGRVQSGWLIGKANFEYDGTPATLSVFTFDEETAVKTLFIPFKDLTNSLETYSGGRYLDVEISGSWKDTDTITLDFNRSYSPNCARSKFYNCVKVLSRALPTTIKAGELKPLRQQR